MNEKFIDFRGSYLFGSRANGTNSKDSDFDILLLFTSINSNKENKILEYICDIEYKFDIFIDIKILTQNELKLQNPFFIEEAINKGVYFVA